MGIGAFAGMLRKKKNYKSDTDGEDTPPSHEDESTEEAKHPPSDSVAGEEYSKVGRKSGDGPDSNPDIEDETDEEGFGTGHDAEPSKHAFASFAHHAGIPKESHGKAHAALKLFVKSCSRSDD